MREENKMIKLFVFMWVLSIPASVSTDSHSFWVLITHIKGNTPFPEIIGTLMLDDMTVGYFDSETKTYFTRGNTTNEDDLYNLGDNNAVGERFYTYLLYKSSHGNNTDSLRVYQYLGICELLDKDKPGQFIFKNAFNGSTEDEMRYFDGKFTYKGPLKNREDDNNPLLQVFLWYQEVFSYPNCLNTLRSYLKKRGAQIKRKGKSPTCLKYRNELIPFNKYILVNGVIKR
ncbi:uncharacterized protein LOC120464142 [Pimephales promelas]|uniref:uncharacterized protein LOC120464142 n=1 Tax=Pimephales promelas TaxID=90988 RepID=UPI001955E3A1|nr:uncharacterized protein LOC120464142 [Pimephales promelas]KAG1924587.1 major histocompatibility complex class I LJA [Pimephales promelas]